MNRSFHSFVDIKLPEGVEEAEAPLSAEGQNAVVLMTVHKAKGLEFPCVFLVNADVTRKPLGEPFYLSAAFGLIPRKPDRQADVENLALYTLLNGCQHDLELEEFRRLFYVGATRAKRQLFITGADDAKENSWIGMFAGALDIKLEQVGSAPLTVEPQPGSVVRVERSPAPPAAPGSPAARPGCTPAATPACRASGRTPADSSNGAGRACARR